MWVHPFFFFKSPCAWWKSGNMRLLFCQHLHTSSICYSLVAAHSSRRTVRKTSQGPNKVLLEPLVLQSGPASTNAACLFFCCCCFFQVEISCRWGQLRKTRRKRAPLSGRRRAGRRWKEERGRKRGHTFMSLSLRDHRAPRQNSQTMAPVCVRSYGFISSQIRRPALHFSLSPLPSHAPCCCSFFPPPLFFLSLCSEASS